jgi:tight adherence protein C
MSDLQTIGVALMIGAGIGSGLVMLASELVPAAPALGPALRRLHQPVLAEEPAPPAGGSRIEQRLGGWLADRYGQWRFIPQTRLRLLGRSVNSYLVSKTIVPLAALVFPAFLHTVLLSAGIRLPWSMPALAGAALAILMFFAVDLDIAAKAEKARHEARYFLAAYIDRVALNRAASRGPVESLERAADDSDNWVFSRIRDRLLRSQLDTVAPWAALQEFAAETGLRELAEIGQIMQLAGEEGGQIYETLRSRARSLRAAIVSDEENEANAATARLYIATPLYVFVLFAAIGYPYLSRALLA